MRSKGLPPQPSARLRRRIFLSTPGGGDPLAGGGPRSGDGQNRFPPGLPLQKLQEVHQEEMEEVVMAQKEMTGKQLKALTGTNTHHAVPGLTVTQTSVETEVARMFP